ncbi:hypothetical protein RCL1_004512 [Eukaryota sp. TZLM3-RCL]
MSGRFSSLVYAFLVVLVVLLVFVLPPPSVSSGIGSLFCIPFVEMQTNELVLGEHLPNFNLNWGSGMRSFSQYVELDRGFYETPDITVSIIGIDSPLNPARVDVEVFDAGPYQFGIRVLTWGDSTIRFVRLSWLAVERQCIDKNIVTDVHTPLFGANSPFSPDWNLNVPGVGERSYSLELLHSSPTQGNPYSFVSLAGFDLANARSNTLSLWLWDVSSTGFYATVSTWDDGRIDSVRLSAMSMVLGEMPNLVYEAGVITVGSHYNNNWNLDRASELVQTFTFTHEFKTTFLRVPFISLSVSTFDSGTTPLRYSVVLESATFTHATFVIKVEPFSVLNSLEITYFAFDIRDVNWTVTDWLLLFTFVFCMLVALVWEFIDSRKVKLLANNPAAFTTGKVAKGTLMEDPQDPPTKFSTDLSEQEKLRAFMQQLHLPSADDAFKDSPPTAAEIKALGKSVEDAEAEWVAMLRSYEESAIFAAKRKRGKYETFMLIAFGMLLVSAIVWFFKDFILATKWFHTLDSLTLSAVILGLEYFLLGTALCLQSWPSIRSLPRNHKNVAILIASHASAGVHPDLAANNAKSNILGTDKLTKENLQKIQKEKEAGFERTLKMASMLVPDGQVFVCHNARGYAPAIGDRTVEVITRVAKWGRNISYVYLPVGNKTLSLLWTAKVWVPKHIDTIVCMDDDIILPHDISFQTNKLKLKKIAGAVPVIRTAPNTDKTGWKRRTILVWMQDFEYLLAGFSKLFQAHVGGTANYPHGAISIWNRSTFVDVLERHDTVFEGEDAQMGLILREFAGTLGDSKS